MTPQRVLASSLFLATALPASLAAETLEICVLSPKSRILSATVHYVQDGVRTEVTDFIELENRCVRFDLNSCSDEVELIIEPSADYKEKRVTCSTDPTPMNIEVATNIPDIVLAAFSDTQLMPDTIVTEVATLAAASLPVLEGISEDARLSALEAFAAANEGDFAQAQFYANEVAEHLRIAGRADLSVAYSSLTYTSAFRAIGIDPFFSGNPLVVATGTPGMVVLNDSGSDALSQYQQYVEPTNAEFVFNRKTSDAIRNTVKATAAEPRGLATGYRDLHIDPTGRAIWR